MWGLRIHPRPRPTADHDDIHDAGPLESGAHAGARRIHSAHNERQQLAVCVRVCVQDRVQLIGRLSSACSPHGAHEILATNFSRGQGKL
jgi:hypothetical protein